MTQIPPPPASSPLLPPQPPATPGIDATYRLPEAQPATHLNQTPADANSLGMARLRSRGRPRPDVETAGLGLPHARAADLSLAPVPLLGPCRDRPAPCLPVSDIGVRSPQPGGGVARPRVTWCRTEGLSAPDGREGGQAGTVLSSLSVFTNTADVEPFFSLHSDG